MTDSISLSSGALTDDLTVTAGELTVINVSGTFKGAILTLSANSAGASTNFETIPGGVLRDCGVFEFRGTGDKIRGTLQSAASSTSVQVETLSAV